MPIMYVWTYPVQSGSFPYVVHSLSYNFFYLMSCNFFRIQQIQLLGRDMKGSEHDKLWNQLEAEIHLHRHKTVIRACRGRTKQQRKFPMPLGHVSFGLLEMSVCNEMAIQLLSTYHLPVILIRPFCFSNFSLVEEIICAWRRWFLFWNVSLEVLIDV